MHKIFIYMIRGRKERALKNLFLTFSYTLHYPYLSPICTFSEHEREQICLSQLLLKIRIACGEIVLKKIRK